jgi:hypothetical protein
MLGALGVLAVGHTYGPTFYASASAKAAAKIKKKMSIGLPTSLSLVVI